MELERLLNEISILVSDETRKIKRASFDEKELSGISLNHFYYMVAVARLEHPTFSSIAQALNVTKSSATVMINKLIAQDYLYKIQSNEDRRVYYVYLKEKGKLLVEAEKLAYKNITIKITSFLSKEELDQFVNLTAKIVDNLHTG
jgi:DNA-binding MarR family transcriptional regulator